MKKTISLLLTLLLCLALLPAAFADTEPPENGWYTDAEGHRFYYVDGEPVKGASRQIEDTWYFFDSETGALLTDGAAFGTDGRTYRAKEDGTLYVNEWYLYSYNYTDHWYYYSADGGSLAGYQKVGSYYYVFNAEDGEMLPLGAQTYAGHSYSIDIYGHATPLTDDGWTKVGENWFYCRNGVVAVEEIVLVGQNYYAFDWEGIMYTDKNGNWEMGNGVKLIDMYDMENMRVIRCHATASGILETNAWLYVADPYGDGRKQWVYFGADAKAYTDGCYRVGNSWYNFDYEGFTTGVPVKQVGWVKTDGVWYYYDEDGVALTGWQQIGGEWYHFSASGKMTANGWVKDSKGWCWMEASGKQAKSKWIKSGGAWYFTDETGYMAADAWARDSKGWCRLGSDGKLVKSKWISDGGEWYYLDASGHMAANAWAKDSVGWCYMGEDGRMVTNCWKKDSKGWCYLGADGRMYVSRWLYDGGNWYYLNGSGYMVTGTQTIGGKTYTFKSNGVWIG